MKRDLRFIPFQPGHLDLIEAKDIFAPYGESRERINSLAYNNQANTQTILLDGRPIAIIGFIRLWGGTAEGWSITSEKIREIPLAFTRLVKELVDIAVRVFELARLQISVREDYVEGQRWAEYLGFKKEGLMLNYGPGRIHHFLYARTT